MIFGCETSPLLALGFYTLKLLGHRREFTGHPLENAGSAQMSNQGIIGRTISLWNPCQLQLALSFCFGLGLSPQLLHARTLSAETVSQSASRSWLCGINCRSFFRLNGLGQSGDLSVVSWYISSFISLHAHGQNRRASSVIFVVEALRGSPDGLHGLPVAVYRQTAMLKFKLRIVQFGLQMPYCRLDFLLVRPYVHHPYSLRQMLALLLLASFQGES
jgi:hypothetical protein